MSLHYITYVHVHVHVASNGITRITLCALHLIALLHCVYYITLCMQHYYLHYITYSVCVDHYSVTIALHIILGVLYYFTLYT